MPAPAGDFTRVNGFHKPTKQQPMIFYCRSGVRAQTAVDLAKAAGYKWSVLWRHVFVQPLLEGKCGFSPKGGLRFAEPLIDSESLYTRAGPATTKARTPIGRSTKSRTRTRMTRFRRSQTLLRMHNLLSQSSIRAVRTLFIVNFPSPSMQTPMQ